MEDTPDANAGTGPDRRTLLSWMGLLVPCGVAAWAGLRPALTIAPTDQPERIPLCRLRDVPAEGVRVQPVSWTVRQGAVVQQQVLAVFLERLPEGGVRAMSARCPHTGCRIEREDEAAGDGYLCRCHDARFARDGAVLSGPPPRGMHQLPVEVPEDDGGMIVWRRGGQAG